MSQQELLIRVIQVLETSGVPYRITGSLVSSLQAEYLGVSEPMQRLRREAEPL